MLPASVSALECIDVPLKTLIQSEEIVLLGHIDAVRNHMVSATSASYNVVTVTVAKLFKGTTPRVIELHQPFVGGGINFWQEIGRDYVFFLRTFTPKRPLSHVETEVATGYVASECISKPVTNFDLKALGAGREPLR